MEVFEKIFGNAARVKLMKLFLFNPEEPISRHDAAERAKVSDRAAQRELRMLRRAGFLRERATVIERNGRKVRAQGYVLSPDFPYANGFRDLFLSASVDRKGLARKLARHGKIQLVVTAGIFLDATDSRVDLLVVGDDIRERGLKGAVGTVEAEIGRQLRYAVLSTADFRYRLGMCDRLVRDILDFPHEVVLDRQGLVA